MYPIGVAELLELIIILWLLVLSFIIYKERGYLRELFPKSESRDIRNKFNEVLGVLEENEKRNLLVNKHLREIAKEGLSHIQKVALIRYNPYGDTGGNVSFSLAILDGKNTGVVLSSLHTRAGTRVYTKEVKEGESELQLSKEELEAVKKAIQEINV